MLAVLISATVVLAQADATHQVQLGPRSMELTQFQGQIAPSKSNPSEAPTAARRAGAQLQHLPASDSMKGAERKANAEFKAVIAQADRVRKKALR
jgi:hypothetical protein